VWKLSERSIWNVGIYWWALREGIAAVNICRGNGKAEIRLLRQSTIDSKLAKKGPRYSKYWKLRGRNAANQAFYNASYFPNIRYLVISTPSLGTQLAGRDWCRYFDLQYWVKISRN
jgi:hypothetical protein